MRANSPTPDNFSVLNPVEDKPANQEPTTEMKKLAKAAKSPDGKIIIDYLKELVDNEVTKLKLTDWTKVDPVIVTANVMASQKLIAEFETTLNQIEISVQAVSDAARAKATAKTE